MKYSIYDIPFLERYEKKQILYQIEKKCKIINFCFAFEIVATLVGLGLFGWIAFLLGIGSHSFSIGGSFLLIFYSLLSLIVCFIIASNYNKTGIGIALFIQLICMIFHFTNGSGLLAINAVNIVLLLIRFPDLKVYSALSKEPAFPYFSEWSK